MNKGASIETILQTHFVKALISDVCGENTKLVARESSYAVRSKVEGERDIHRVILLPPKGYTANKINQMNSHDEAEHATIEVKGAVREKRNGFSKLKDCLFIASHYNSGEVSGLNQPYLTYNIDSESSPDLIKQLHSAGTAPFPVVKNDGYGFYHNLVNITDDWLVLKLHKVLRPQKSVDLSSHLQNLSTSDARILQSLHESIVKYGDKVFKNESKLVDSVSSIPLSSSLPALGEMLYVHDSGMHEACTAFAIILNIGKKYPLQVSEFLNSVIETNSIPTYYAQQLLGKISNVSKNNYDYRVPVIA